MGFKYKKVTFTCGDANFPTTTTEADLRLKSETIVKAVVQALIDMNIGWQLDPSRSTSITDFTEVPVVTDTRTYPGLFLTNSVSGNKLFVAYLGVRNSLYNFYINDNYDQLFGYYNPSNTSAKPLVSGLVMSMIPGDANQSFGASFGSDFLPSSATRLIGTADGYTYSNTSPNNIAIRASSNTIFAYGIFATEYCIMISGGYSVNGSMPGINLIFALGRVLSDLAHSEDILATARYGVVKFSYGSSSNSPGVSYTELSRFTSYSDITVNGYTRNVRGSKLSQSANYNTSVTQNLPCQFFNSSGGVINVSSSTMCSIYPLQPEITCSNVISTITGTQGRWCPYVAYVMASDLQTNGIIPGDGVKGYLDTDLFRHCGNDGYAKLFDNGTWIGTNYFMIVSWDPNNDSL